jgi:hypothetical protein
VPEVVILPDHFGGCHHRGVEVGEVALQPDQRLSPGQAGFVENAVPGVVLDEPGGLCGALSVDDRAGAGLLCVERFWSRRARLAE